MASLQSPKWPLTVSLPQATSHGQAWVSDDTDLVSQRAVIQDEGERLMLVPPPQMASKLQSSHCDPLMGTRAWVYTPSASWRMVVYVCWLRIWADKCTRTSFGRSWRLGFCPWSPALLRTPLPGILQDPPPNSALYYVGSAETELAKLRSLTKLCGLWVSVETYIALKGSLYCKHC